MSRPHFVLVAGANGAGKSTLTRSLQRKYKDISTIDPDLIAKEISGSFSKIAESRITAGKETIHLAQEHIRNQQSLILESTVSGKIHFKYFKHAKASGLVILICYTIVQVKL